MMVIEAIRAGDVSRLPSRRAEGWRWTDLPAVLRMMPELAGAAEAPPGPAVLADLDWPTHVVVNGRAGTDGPVAHGRLIRRFSAVGGPSRSVAEDDLVVDACQSLVLIDVVQSTGPGVVAATQGRIRVGPGAALDRLVLLDDAADAVSVARFEIDVAEGAEFRQIVLSRGALRQRFETRLVAGRSSEVRLDGAYVLSGRRHADQTTELRHVAGPARSRQLVKGLAGEAARSVFQGRIVVSEGADGVDARMGSHALLLSDSAEADAKPELEIYADDVQCAHGNTVGALDPDAVFYAQSRGLPRADAERLLSEAYVNEVAGGVANAALRDVALTWVAKACEELMSS